MTDNLCVYHVNCQSFFVHLNEFRNCFQAHFFYLIYLSETWLKPDITDSMVHLQNYIYLICYDMRLGKNGGNVGVYIHTSINTKLLVILKSQYQRTEYLLLEIPISNLTKVLITVVYRPFKIGYFKDFKNKCLELFSYYFSSLCGISITTY